MTPAVGAASPGRPALAPGDVIGVHRRHQGRVDPFERFAVVLELPHRCPWPCRVRWDDNGLEELLYPRADLLIELRSAHDGQGLSRADGQSEAKSTAVA